MKWWGEAWWDLPLLLLRELPPHHWIDEFKQNRYLLERKIRSSRDYLSPFRTGSHSPVPKFLSSRSRDSSRVSKTPPNPVWISSMHGAKDLLFAGLGIREDWEPRHKVQPPPWILVACWDPPIGIWRSIWNGFREAANYSDVSWDGDRILEETDIEKIDRGTRTVTLSILRILRCSKDRRPCWNDWLRQNESQFYSIKRISYS